MTKANLVSIVSNQIGSSKKETEAIIDAFLNAIIVSMQSHERIEIRGFGSFFVKKRMARLARNPRTGEKVPIKEKYVPAFKISKEFKKVVHPDT